MTPSDAVCERRMTCRVPRVRRSLVATGADHQHRTVKPLITVMTRSEFELRAFWSRRGATVAAAAQTTNTIRLQSRLAVPSPATGRALCRAVIRALALCSSWHPLRDDL